MDSERKAEYNTACIPIGIHGATSNSLQQAVMLVSPFG